MDRSETSRVRTRSRRAFLLQGAALSGLAVLPSARVIAAAADTKKLSFFNTHTAEKLSISYSRNGRYLPDALSAINNLLRDHRSGDACKMDPKLFDLLHALQVEAGQVGTFEIISGYRSPATNAKLRKQGRGVAKRSYHMKGMAIDVRLADHDTAALKRAALALGRGGVGYYAKSDFLHLDTGPFRSW